MPSSWMESIRSGYRITRRRQRSFGALEALESRTLLSAGSIAQGSAAVDAPRIYGPVQLNSNATRLKGKYMNDMIGNLKFKADLNGLDATGVAKGKIKPPVYGKGKLVMNMTFTLLNTVYWEGQYEAYFKKDFLSSGMIHGDKIP